jgi:transcriptional regulator GlxA family with amidase domain
MKKVYLVILMLISSSFASYAQSKLLIRDSVYACGPCDGSCDTIQFSKAGICPHCNMALTKMSKGDFIKQNDKTPVTICFYLQDGIELLDFAGPLEVFTDAGFKVFTVSKTKAPIRSQGVLSINPDYSIKDAPSADILVVFGGNTGPTESDPEVIGWMKSRIPQTKSYLSVCTGSFIFGRMGILDGLTATSYHTQIESMQRHFPKTKVLANTRFIDNGNVITTAGISAGIDGALHLVAKLKGNVFAKGIAQVMEYDKWVPEQGLILNNTIALKK